MEQQFTANIKAILKKYFGEKSDDIFNQSLLIQYLNFKTRSVNKGSKSRSSFANLYAIYVIVEDYIAHNYHQQGDYSQYQGASFVKLFERQRELPFGEKLQNHALNNRMNAEFQKYFPTSEHIPILRNLQSNKYWINEHLLKIQINQNIYNIAMVIIDIINEYIKIKQYSLNRFIETLQNFQKIDKYKKEEIVHFIHSLLEPDVDARLFEIVSYAILKYYYHNQFIYWGYDTTILNKENLNLFKTGRTNANDGGIDFVMKPLGRFFQVTETLDFKKYFLDIDKIQKYPITFVIKSKESKENILFKIRENAKKKYLVVAIIDRYMNCIEEIINIPILKEYFERSISDGHINNILNEIMMQSKVEFNYFA